MDGCAVLRHRLWCPLPASQPPACSPHWTLLGDCAQQCACTPAGGVCERTKNITRTQTYLTRCCNTAAAVAALQTGGVQFRMQLCGRACRNWTMAWSACNSGSLLSREMRLLSGRSIALVGSVCLLCCCPPGAASRKSNVSPNASTASRAPEVGRDERGGVSSITRGPFAQPFQLGVRGVKADSGRERVLVRQGTVHRRRRLFEYNNQL
jgi:hypothetical protein